MPSSSGSNASLVPTRLPSPEKRRPHLVSHPFLTALAVQERRVLELKEELHQADEDLQKLKQQWAVHEATKKKNELRNWQPLKKPPLGSSMPSDDDSVRASRELDRRGITPFSIKPSRRKVFAGSRHIRPLSLLSPKDLGSHSDLLVHDNGPSKPHQDAADDVAVPATVPELSPLDAESDSEKEVILETGKHLVYDFRQGLWTFFEDFKQLTVGDEGISTASLRDHRLIALATIPRRQNMKEKRSALQGTSARNALDVVRGPSRKLQIKISSSDERVGSALDRPTESVVPTPTIPETEGGHNASSSDSDDDGWDNWDSPKESTPRRAQGMEPIQ